MASAAPRAGKMEALILGLAPPYAIAAPGRAFRTVDRAFGALSVEAANPVAQGFPVHTNNG